MKTTPPRMISTGQELSAALADVPRELVGVDTEFVWERTYYPELGLIQLGFVDGTVLLLDMPALDDATPLVELLAHPDTTCMLHDAKQDLEIIYQNTGALPAKVFDTRLAAGFTGRPATLSLAALVEEIIGDELPKGETRSNWLQRPLSESQKNYAADDVRVLPPIYHRLQQDLEGRDTLGWLDEEHQRLCDPAQYVTASPSEVAASKGLGGVPSRLKGHAFALTTWRETMARELNKPRSFIMRDDAMVSMIKSLDDPRRMERGLSGYKKRMPEAWATLVELLDANDWPDGPPRKPRLPDWPKETIKDTLERIRERARAHDVDPSLVISRNAFNAAMGFLLDPSGTPPLALTGWRKGLVEPELLALKEVPA